MVFGEFLLPHFNRQFELSMLSSRLTMILNRRFLPHSETPKDSHESQSEIFSSMAVRAWPGEREFSNCG